MDDPADAPSDSDQPTLDVLTYNVHHGEGEDGVYDLERIADVIRNSGADVVGLQELDWNFLFDADSDSRSNRDEQMALLADWLDMEYAFTASIEMEAIAASGGEPRRYGIGILSDYPIVDTVAVTLPEPETQNEFDEQRQLLGAELDVDGRTVQFYTTHLGLTPEQRTAQVETILDTVTLAWHPTLVVGDFNAEPDSDPHRAMTDSFVDVLDAVGETHYTFPAPYEGDRGAKLRPDERVRIDYVFASADLEPVAGNVTETVASDHLPVRATVGLPRD